MNTTTLPTITFMGDRDLIQRAEALVTAVVADRAVIHVPRMEALSSILARKPIVVLASDDAAFARGVLRELKAQTGADFAVFVFTARPGAFNDLLSEFPNAKFIDGTEIAPLDNWFTSGLLAKKLLEALPAQEPAEE